MLKDNRVILEKELQSRVELFRFSIITDGNAGVSDHVNEENVNR